MFIVWGRKAVFRRLGYVADFCPMCRDARPFELRRVGVAGHIYYVSLGEGQFVGNQRVCQDCKTAFNANPAHYASVSKALTPLEELARQTFPKLREAYQAVFSLEDRIRNSPTSLSPEERRSAIRNPLLFLSPKVEKRFESTHIDRQTGLAFLATILALFGGIFLVGLVAPSATDSAALTIVSLGALYIVWSALGSGRRYLRSEIVPVLVRTLRPIQPTEAEVRAALEEVRAAGHRIGAKLKAGEVMAAFASVR